MDAWTDQLRRWPTLIILVFGQASNILSVLVLGRPKLRKNTCSMYLLGASVSNTICLFVGVFYFLISSGFGYSLQSKSRVLCKLLPYLFYSTLFLGSWFILLACIDRYCSTHSRAAIRRLSHIDIAKWLVVFLPIFSLIVHIHFLIFIDWIQVGRCTFTVWNYLLFFYIYYMVIYAFTTPILYIIFAVRTIYNVEKAKKAVALVIKRHGKIIQRQQTLNAQLLRMLLVQVISFVVLTMPLAAWNVYAGISVYWQKSASTRSLEALVSIIFRLMTFINIGSTGVVYSLTSRLFREELSALFQCQWFKKVIRREGQSRVFYIPRRIAPA